jgi:hypothetical protein
MQESAGCIPVLLLVDTTGCDCEEEVTEEGGSKSNRGEAAIVLRHVQQLVDAGLHPEQIGVITPYNGQVGESSSSILASASPGLTFELDAASRVRPKP